MARATARKSKVKTTQKKAKKSARKSAKKSSPTKKRFQFQSDKHLREFCEATCQQLSNVLGAITGELDYALETPNAQTRDRAMRMSLAAAEKALSLSRNLRYYALNSRLHSEVSDLAQVLIDTVDLVESEFEAKNINITVFAEAATYHPLDPNALQQSLLNLLYYMAECLPSGGHLSLSLARKKKRIEIKIRDNAQPWTEDELDAIFEIYPAREPKENIQSLGLAVARTLIEAQGGHLDITAAESQGNTFIIEFPATATTKKTHEFRTQRNYRRIEANLPAELEYREGQKLLTETKILSIRGCFLKVHDTPENELPAIDSKCSLKLFYFEDNFITLENCRVANVCWSAGHKGLGIEFLEIDSKAKRILAGLVQSRS